ncbi:superoxide dismutase [bacterium]|nr:superoxide dismutase [bacterium]
MAHSLPDLNYDYSSLEPHIDAKTMEIHHTKHHQTYVTNLNKALDQHPDLYDKSLEFLLLNLSEIPEDIKGAVRNHGGGHHNHSLFWRVIGPNTSQPSDGLLKRLIKDFGSFDEFKSEFADKSTKQFGSGWGWLCEDRSGKLITTSTANQDSPISSGLKPILGIDVWEHAYYLNYQNRRPDYISSFWNIVNWEEVEKNLK